ncbi:hypothetical protein ACQ86N_34825 [Puia sp. P3]|uniref:hypothetical protein n=1 Tax=Puia sp. P3 TaxID=3423952 RepID=UPI003D66C0D4
MARLDAFLALVAQERGYEDCSEGKRWLDLKRMGIVKLVIQNIKGIAVADETFALADTYY